MQEKSTGLVDSFVCFYAGRIDKVAYAVLGAWLTGMGVSYLADSPMTFQTAVSGLIGNLLVVALALAIKLRRKRT